MLWRARLLRSGRGGLSRTTSTGPASSAALPLCAWCCQMDGLAVSIGAASNMRCDGLQLSAEDRRFEFSLLAEAAESVVCRLLFASAPAVCARAHSNPQFHLFLRTRQAIATAGIVILVVPSFSMADCIASK